MVSLVQACKHFANWMGLQCHPDPSSLLSYNDMQKTWPVMYDPFGSDLIQLYSCNSGISTWTDIRRQYKYVDTDHAGILGVAEVGDHLTSGRFSPVKLLVMMQITGRTGLV